MRILCLLNSIFDELVALDAVGLVILLQAGTVVVSVDDQRLYVADVTTFEWRSISSSSIILVLVIFFYFVDIVLYLRYHEIASIMLPKIVI